MDNYIRFLFIFLLFLTPLPQHWFGASSFLSGTLSFIMLFLVINGFIYNKIRKKVLDAVIFVILLLLLHFFVVFFLFEDIDFLRGFLSIVALFLMLIGAFFFSMNILYVSQESFTKLIDFIFICFIIVFVGKYIPIIQNYNDHLKPVMPFNEPSHYALFFIPVYFFKLYTSQTNTRKYLLFFTGLGIGILLTNLTMILGVFLGAVVTFRNRIFLFLFIIVSLFPILGIYVDLGYFSERILFSKDSNNLSVLVFIQGWQLAYESFFMTKGLGVGFQQLGVVYVKTEVGSVIEKITSVSNVNVSDAGLTAPKIISELGIIGFFLIVYYIFYSIKLCVNIVKVDDVKLIFAYVVFISFSIDLFVRGIGYFNAPFFFFLVSIFVIKRYRK